MSRTASNPAEAARVETVASDYSHTLPLILHRLGISALVSTYQAGQLIVLRADDEKTLSPLYRNLPQPMGIAVGRDLAIGTHHHIHEYRHHPAAARELDSGNRHDLVLMPSNSKLTGDIRIHEMVYQDQELWFANTRFSCLATIDRDHSFVPRWQPPFISRLADEDRCHLNGIGMRDGRIAYVSALGATDTPNGWREHKAHGGILMAFPSGAIVASGLSMPHSPRWHENQLWFLESGKGSLARLDAAGAVETLIELPGFTRGLAFAGRYAFIGLSRVRETNAFGGIPLNTRVEEKRCGVAVVDVIARKQVGLLEFKTVVDEVFDVQLIRARWPEVVDVESGLLATSYLLPSASLR